MRSTRRLLVALSATLVLLLAIPALGQAARFHLEIDHALLDLGSISGVTAIDSTSTPPDPPASLTGTVNGGKVRVPRTNFVFPTKTTEVTNGLEATVDLTANRDITGQLDAATGRLTLAFDLKATVQALDQTCVIDPIRASLSTDYGRPYLGVPFAAGTEGPGALTGRWDDLPAPTGGTVCQIVGQLTIGPGGIWMAHGLSEARKCEDDPTHPGCDDSNPCANGPSSECCAAQPRFAPCNEDEGTPRLSIKVSPKAKKVRAGRAAVLTVKVRNRGDARAAGARICARAPRKKAQAGKCRTGAVPAGGTLTRKFKVKVKRKARGRVKVAFKLTAPGTPARTARATLKVRG
mgnify:CR=1 FL=1